VGRNDGGREELSDGPTVTISVGRTEGSCVGVSVGISVSI